MPPAGAVEAGRHRHAGGHVRVGLEDAPLGTGVTNLEWVRAAADLIREAGGRLATPAEVRAATGGSA